MQCCSRLRDTRIPSLSRLSSRLFYASSFTITIQDTHHHTTQDISNVTRPDMLGKYELLSKLATGGMAEVYLARERGLAGMERFVVIKRILPHLAQHPSFVEMFLREGRLIARLNHPNIVQIYELGADAGQQYFLALEYIPGITLRELQVLANKRGEMLPEEVVLAIGMQTAAGLEAAHAMKDNERNPLGLVHRDVTPHNLMCMESGLIKLLDFGIAKATQGQSEATYSGDLKGKFSYMSPEQALQQPLDARSDIFSLGIVLWESLTGRRLFKRASQLEMLQAISTGDAPSPDMWRSGLGQGTVNAIMKALATDPADRFQSAREFRQALMDAAEQAGLQATQDRVHRFVHGVARERLEERAQAVKAASELDELSEHQRHRLLHETSSGIFDPGGGEDEELPTIVERPSGKTQSSSSFGARPFQGEEPPQLDDPEPPTVVRAAPLPETLPAPRASVSRKIIGAVFLTTVLGMIAGFVAIQMDLFAPSYSHPPITLVWAPIVDPEVLEVEMRPLHDHLSRELEREVRFEVAPSYEEAARRLTSGEAEYAILPPLLYVKTSRNAPQIMPIAIKEFDGSMTSDGLLLVSAGIRAGDINALRGKKFCLTDRSSTTGNFLPRAYLRDQGEDPDEFIEEIIWSGDHLQLLRDLSDGKCDVGATHSGAFIAADKFGVPVSKLRTFAITGHVPQDVVCASATPSEQEREAMREVLMAIKPEELFGSEYLGETQRITGFVEASDDLYKQLRKALDAEVAKK